nr:type II toxin-antitoxin system VapC family toxin [[Pseudopropionibacterium] massiliense]
MIVDPSAIAAILLKEPEGSGFRELLGRRGGRLSISS